MKRTPSVGLSILVLLASALGTSGTTVDQGPSTPSSGDLANIRFVGPPERTVSLRDLHAGMEIAVEIVVQSAVTPWRAAPLDGAGCQRPDNNGLILFPVVYQGQDIVYCPACDVGYCADAGTPDTPALRAGTYRYVFRWHGERGFGPSHYAWPLKPRLGSPEIEPGEYRVTVTTAFKSASAQLDKGLRKSESSVVIHVVP